MKNLIEKLLQDDIWNISGSIGKIHTDKLECRTDVYEIKAEYSVDINDVYHYCGCFRNTSDEKITLNCLKSKFCLGGGEFEVYTQYNGWQNENIGKWQELNTEISVSTRGIRSTYGASPFMAIKNRQTGRGIVFHLLSDYAWVMQVRMVPKDGEISVGEIEIGVNSENFLIDVEPKESINTPDIIFYEFTNDIDFDCDKLHKYYIDNYSRKSMPVVYNTWLCRFDKISFENIKNQISRAAQIGSEYFVVDAGWFGTGKNWGTQRGDWYENETGGFCGRMKEISDIVRANSMKFGLWFEIESASAEANILKQHKEYFVESNGLYFLDFTSKAAREYIYDVLKRFIEKYNIEYIKFDFNQDVDYDNNHCAYTKYHKAYRAFIQKLKKDYPDMYMENCASGGMRMDLRNAIDFDSFWLSDNQSPYEGIRIFKEGIKRLPPQCIEKWAVINSIENFEPSCYCNETEKIISTNDGTWNSVVGVNQSFLKGFLSGGPIGISCDLNALSDKLLDELTEHIAMFKREREFWQNAVCNILIDTEKILALEYMTASRVKVIVYTYKVSQESVYVYPKIDANDTYHYRGKVLSGSEIVKNGIEIKLNGNYSAVFAELEKC